MSEQIEIPPSPARAAATSGASAWSSPAPSRGLGRLLAHGFSQAGARVTLGRPHRGRPQGRRRRAARARRIVCSGDVADEAFNEAVADATVAEWGGRRRLDRQRRDLADRRRPPRHRPGDLARGARREPHRPPSSAPGPPPGSWARAGASSSPARCWASGPGKGLAAYSASKAGLVGLAKGLALDLAPAGITVNVVAPGWFDSPLADGWKNNPKLAAAILGHTAQQRWGDATDLAGAYQFLASDASAFVTGTVLNVDGGYLLV